MGYMTRLSYGEIVRDFLVDDNGVGRGGIPHIGDMYAAIQ